MGMTMTEKILARASGAKTVSPGDLVVTDVDTAVLIDNAFLPAYWREMLKVHDPEKMIVVFDHRAPAVDSVSACAHVMRALRQAVRYQAIPRCRRRCRHRPCRRRRSRLRPSGDPPRVRRFPTPAAAAPSTAPRAGWVRRT